MNQKQLLLSIAGLIGAGTAFADWTIVNTYDDASSLDTVTDTINIEGSGAGSSIVDGMWALNPGDLFEATSNLYSQQDLGVDLKAASIAASGPVTFYFELMQPTIDGSKAIVDHSFGLAIVDEDEVLTERFNSFSAMQRVQVGDTYEVRDGSSYHVIDTLQADVKYKIWIVADYVLNDNKVYIQGGQWADQTELTSADLDEYFGFRVTPSAEQTVDKFMVAVSRGNSVDGEKAQHPLYFDNLAVDTAGENLTAPVVGGWTVVNTYDDASALDSVVDVINIEGSGAGSSIVDGMWALNPGDLFEATSNLYSQQDLGVDLKAASEASGAPVTFYFEMMQPIIDGTKAIVDHSFGLAIVDEDEVLTERFNSFSAMQRVQVGDTYEVRDGSSYHVIDTLQGDVKYSIWIVADYVLNDNKVYIQGGQWADQTELTSADLDEYFGFRVTPSAEQTVDKFMVAVSRGNSVDGEKAQHPLYFDNIAVDVSGENLSMPSISGGEEPTKGPGYMGNYDVVEGGDGQDWVDTGDWLGWVNIENYPVIFILDLDSWAYIGDAAMDGDKDANGAWVYVFK